MFVDKAPSFGGADAARRSASPLGANMKRLTTLIAIAVLGVVALANVRGADQSRSEQAVLVHFDYGSRDLAPFFQFEDRLEQAIKASGAGEYDGNELAIDGSDGTLYM